VRTIEGAKLLGMVGDEFEDDLITSPAPWKIGPYTHYGTEVFDSKGTKLFSILIVIGRPSAREQAGLSDGEWDEHCCDRHWESQTQWHIASAIVAARNAMETDRHSYGEHRETLHKLLTLVEIP
jgi:hypothetical protein